MKLSKDDARRFLLRYQRLDPPRRMKSDEEIVDFVRKVGCIQYDPLHVVARNADLVLQSRCRGYTEATLYRLLYESRELVDGWDKNMSIWSVTDWPCFARKREALLRHYEGRAKELDPVVPEIRRIVANGGVLSSKDIDVKRKIDWAWAPTQVGRAALEAMFHGGELVVHHREGSRKYYGAAERLLPKAILRAPDPNRNVDEYRRWYMKRRIGSIGLLWNKGSDAWLGTQMKSAQRTRAITELVDSGDIVEIEVEDINVPCYIVPDYMSLLEKRNGRREAAVIAPLDNLLWDRKMISRLFGFDYTWEVYTPASKRKHGYYVLPVLYGDRFVARFEPVIDRSTRTLQLRNWWWEAGISVDLAMTAALSRCIWDFMAFLGVGSLSIAPSLVGPEFDWLRELDASERTIAGRAQSKRESSTPAGGDDRI